MMFHFVRELSHVHIEPCLQKYMYINQFALGCHQNILFTVGIHASAKLTQSNTPGMNTRLEL